VLLWSISQVALVADTGDAAATPHQQLREVQALTPKAGDATATCAHCETANAAAPSIGLAEFWPNLFSTEDFPPRWHCGEWTAFNGWLNIASDLLIWVAYTGIGTTLFILVRRRRNPPFRGLVYLFGAFIFACGLTHLLEALLFWWPAYRFLGLVKALTAVVSVGTLVALIPAIPVILSMRFPKELEEEIRRRRVVEEELRSSGLRYRQLVEAMTDCAWFSDANGAFVDPQPSWEAFSGQSFERYRDFGWQTIFHPEDQEILKELWAETVRRGGLFEMTGRVQTSPERDFQPVEVFAVPVRQRRGTGGYQIVGWFGAVVDLSEERRLYHERGQLVEALETERMELEQLVRVVTHDLRSPLVNVKGFALEVDRGCAELRRLLAGLLPENPPSRVVQLLERELPESADFIAHSAGRMDQLLSGLLRFSRLGRTPLEPVEIPLGPFFEELEKTFQFQIREVGGFLEVGSLPTVFADRAQLGQVFANLLDNALKYRDPERPPHIRVSGESTPEGAMIYVRDNGIGIASQDRKAVFQVFRRLHVVEVGGEGLGLSAVQIVLQRHGGEIEIRDNGREPGTCFVITLPTRLNCFEGNPNVVVPILSASSSRALA
jgi:PAS domain S-box-containing protein